MPTCPVKNRTKCNHIKQVTHTSTEMILSRNILLLLITVPV